MIRAGAADGLFVPCFLCCIYFLSVCLYVCAANRRNEGLYPSHNINNKMEITIHNFHVISATEKTALD